MARYWVVFQCFFFVVVVVPSSVNATELYKIARLSGLNYSMTANGL